MIPTHKPRPLDPYLDRFFSWAGRKIRSVAAKSPSPKPSRATRDQLKALQGKFSKKGKAA